MKLISPAVVLSESDIRELQDENESLREDLYAMSDLQAEIERLTEENERLKDELDKSNASLDKIRDLVYEAVKELDM